jgi:hypothetical protein
MIACSYIKNHKVISKKDFYFSGHLYDMPYSNKSKKITIIATASATK